MSSRRCGVIGSEKNTGKNEWKVFLVMIKLVIHLVTTKLDFLVVGRYLSCIFLPY